MNACLLWVLCVVRYRSLRRSDHSSIGVLLTVVRRCVWSRNLVKKEALAHWGAVAPKKKIPICIGNFVTVLGAVTRFACSNCKAVTYSSGACVKRRESPVSTSFLHSINRNWNLFARTLFTHTSVYSACSTREILSPIFFLYSHHPSRLFKKINKILVQHRLVPELYSVCFWHASECTASCTRGPTGISLHCSFEVQTILFALRLIKVDLDRSYISP